MILDTQLMFDPAGTAITATAASTNILDLSVGRDLGIGDNPALKILVVPGAAFTAAGAATLQIAVQGAPDNGSGAPGTWTTYAQTDVLALATLNATGADLNRDLFGIDLPSRPPGITPPRFLRLNYTVATGPMTAGTLQAYLIIGRDDLVGYPNNYTNAYPAS